MSFVALVHSNDMDAPVDAANFATVGPFDTAGDARRWITDRVSAPAEAAVLVLEYPEFPARVTAPHLSYGDSNPASLVPGRPGRLIPVYVTPMET